MGVPSWVVAERIALSFGRPPTGWMATVSDCPPVLPQQSGESTPEAMTPEAMTPEDRPHPDQMIVQRWDAPCRPVFQRRFRFSRRQSQWRL